MSLNAIDPSVPIPTIVNVITPLLGCDPELFIAHKGKIVGAETVIPEDGLDTPETYLQNLTLSEKGPKRKGIVLDGVQVELNPRPNTCRAILCNEISAAMTKLREHLKKIQGMEACFKQVIEIDPKELDKLSDKAKALGCAPSRNIYNSKATVGVDPATYTKRSAGGHIHIGLTGYDKLYAKRERLVVLLDVLLGNTSVLIDRDPGNAERRKVYGRAGEHRLPTHGLEYRTLSNFWLKSYPLASMVFGMSRLATNVLANAVYGGTYEEVEEVTPRGDKMKTFVGMGCWKDAESDLLSKVDVDAVQTAINTNDLELAKENWKAVATWLTAHAPHFGTGIYGANVEDFNYFVKTIDEKSLDYWFPYDPIIAWTDKYGRKGSSYGLNGRDGHSYGWESFLRRVQNERTGGIKFAA